ncbi:MAG: hypothetical protein ABI767_11440 [Rhodanobacter sp.]
MRLWRESPFLPALPVDVRDLSGTKLF